MSCDECGDGPFTVTLERSVRIGKRVVTWRCCRGCWVKGQA